LNTAPKDQLQSLPGITAAEADRVIADRSYHDPEELVRHILAKSKYDRIADLVKAK
jgi:DNA uptake protein ComE-like DNA-binding protein